MTSVAGQPACSRPVARIVREFCGSQSCTVLHRSAFSATERPANQLMQLSFKIRPGTENPRVGGSIPPLATTPNFLKRNGFPASPADYRRPRGRKIGRPSDYRKSGRSRGSAGARRGAGGNLADWKPGTLGVRAARRGAGRRGPAVARSARVGRTRAAAMASPMARRRASLAGAGMRLQRKPTPVLAKASTV